MRYVLGPNFQANAAVATAPADPNAHVLADVEVTLKGVDAKAWTCAIGIPAYDPATHAKLAEIRVYLAPEGGTLPADGPGWVASPHPVQVADVAGVVAGADAAIPLPAVKAGNYMGQVVLGFAD